MNNRHSIALTGSSPRPLGTSTSFTLLGVLASLTLLSVQPRHASKESKTKHCRRTRARIHTSPSRQSHEASSVEPDDHYPLTCTPENGIWMLGNLNTYRFLSLPGSEAKSSNLMMFYEGKKPMSMISWGRKGTQAIFLFISYCNLDFRSIIVTHFLS